VSARYRNLGRGRYGFREPDAQQPAVYRAEGGTVDRRGAARRFGTVQELGRWLRRASRSEWFAEACAAARFPGVPEVHVHGVASRYWRAHPLEDGREFSSATWGLERIDIWLPRGHALTDSYALHELCHPISRLGASAHGPAFCARLVEAHELFGGRGAAGLLAALRAEGARVGPRRRWL
jgi:hypothetical protein